MDEFIQMTINGLVLGTTLALFVMGFSLAMGVVRIFNMAHAAFYAISGLAVWWITDRADINYWVSIVLIVLAMGLVGVIVERFLYRPFRGNLLSGMVVALGLMYVMQGGTTVVLEESGLGLTAKSLPRAVHGVLHVGGADVAKERIVIILVSIGLILALVYFLNRTKLGWAVRATSQDSDSARLQGIRVANMSAVTMLIAGLLVAAAAGLMTPVYGATPEGGFEWLMKGMIAITLGGLGSIGGTLSACLLLGLIESYAVTKIGGHEAMIILFGILVLILLVRPLGFAGEHLVEELQ